MNNKMYEQALDRIRAGNQTWLVTGCAGFIGSNLLEALLKLDQRVVGLDNLSTGSPRNFELVKAAVTPEQWARFQFIRGDIRSPEDCARACLGVHYVLHQAALGSVVRSIEDPMASHDNNVNGFLNMLLAARDAKVGRFVYASSSATYGDHPALPKVEARIGRALSPYGLTKYINELYAAIFAECYGFKAIGMRYFNVYGPRQDPDATYAAVIPIWIAAMLRGQPAYINGDGNTTRDFCYIGNVVQANLLAAMAEDPAALDQAYNVAVHEQTSLNDLFALLRDLLARRFPHIAETRPHYRDFRIGDVKHSLADVSMAERLLGYQPTVAVKEGMARTVDWYVANHKSETQAAEAIAAEAGAEAGVASAKSVAMAHPAHVAASAA